MVSASRRWLIETMIPTLIHVPITFVTGTSIIVASSLAVTNSVSFRILLSAASSFRRSSISARAFSRLSLRYLALLLPLFLFVRRARVSFTCFATSSSETSCLTGAFFFLLCFPFPLLLLLLLLFLFLLPFLPLLPLFCCATAFMSTRSTPMRLRFFFLPSPLP